MRVPGPAFSAVPAVSRAAAELAACGSLEITAGHEAEVGAVAAALPVGTRVFVNHLPRSRLIDALPTLKALHDRGLDPVPHIAARRLGARLELGEFLAAATSEAGVKSVLLIGGDVDRPAGPFADSIELLRDGALGAAGLAQVGLAGYPEGHPRIAPGLISNALDSKLSLVAAQGMSAYMVTQFSFAPARVIAYCDRIAREYPGLPIYVGLAGPADAATLLRYARRCGVGASLRALQGMGMNAVRVVTHTDPGEQLVTLARYHAAHPASNIAGIHLFSFGGAGRSALWLRHTIAADPS
jgi:methylenetetrahydrofolate reductase (NADPH)